MSSKVDGFDMWCAILTDSRSAKKNDAWSDTSNSPRLKRLGRMDTSYPVGVPENTCVFVDPSYAWHKATAMLSRVASLLLS